MRGPVSYVRRVRQHGFTPREFLSICVSALVLLAIIVVTGGVVRLTGSGLGCTDWPNCSNDRFVDVSDLHSAVEQVNRFFTFVVCVGVALAALAARFRRPRRRDLTLLSVAMLVGVPAQGLVGAVVVWTDVNPFAVQWHMFLSLILITVATVMIVRSRRPDGAESVRLVSSAVRNTVRVLGVLTVLVLVAGTVVTGTGPHAGDEEARRFFGTARDIDGGALVWVTRVHGTLVWLAVAAACMLFWQLRRSPSDRRALDAPLTAWAVTAMLQGTVGYVQYAAGLPAGLVAAHLAGATVMTASTTWLWISTSGPSPAGMEAAVQHLAEPFDGR